SGLTSIEIPSSVTRIGEGAFLECIGLKDVYINDIAAWCEIAFGSSFSNPLWHGANLYINNELVANLVIPEGVTSIGDCAFRGCSSLTSIEIPSSVTSIGKYAFSASELASIEIPSSVTSIGDSAFWFCTELKDVYINDLAAWCGIDFGSIDSNPLSDGANLYVNNELVANLVIPEGVTSIGFSAFYGCSGLTSIVIPNSVTSIGYNAFDGCTGLTSITIPESVTSIYRSAFNGCSSLESITLPFVGAELNGTEDIHFGYIFGASSSNNNGSSVPSSLKTVIITEGVTSIGDSAFSGCSGLTNIEIPSSVKRIGEDAFYDCSGLMSIEIPESVTSIGSGAFSGCSGLTSIEIPSSVTSISCGAFLDCFSLESITLPFVGSTPNGTEKTHFGYIFGAYDFSVNAQYVPSSLKTVIITDGVTSIGNYAFSGCSGLTSIVIPDSVTSIGNYAFSGCSSLTEVYYTGSESKWKAISIGSSNSNLTNATIHYNYVPEE
ncbi:MAG: leucine-rich repeat domain-containing protein, partial [Clostridia bacterium]|nr:leucine-rich repeat domain-containing protein [Clostridia bacterium]